MPVTSDAEPIINGSSHHDIPACHTATGHTATATHTDTHHWHDKKYDAVECGPVLRATHIRSGSVTMSDVMSRVTRATNANTSSRKIQVGIRRV